MKKQLFKCMLVLLFTIVFSAAFECHAQNATVTGPKQNRAPRKETKRKKRKRKPQKTTTTQEAQVWPPQKTQSQSTNHNVNNDDRSSTEENNNSSTPSKPKFIVRGKVRNTEEWSLFGYRMGNEVIKNGKVYRNLTGEKYDDETGMFNEDWGVTDKDKYATYSIIASPGDKLTFTGWGLMPKNIEIDETTRYVDIELSPKLYSESFQVLDEVTKKPLVGTMVIKNIEHHNWENGDMELIGGEKKVTGIEGETLNFLNVKYTDFFYFFCAGYRITCAGPTVQTGNSDFDFDNNYHQMIDIPVDDKPMTIFLKPYGQDTYPVYFRIGGPFKSANIVNLRNGETTKYLNSSSKARLFVRLGDVVRISAGGCRTEEITFSSHIIRHAYIRLVKGKSKEVNKSEM